MCCMQLRQLETQAACFTYNISHLDPPVHSRLSLSVCQGAWASDVLFPYNTVAQHNHAHDGTMYCTQEGARAQAPSMLTSR